MPPGFALFENPVLFEKYGNLKSTAPETVQYNTVTRMIMVIILLLFLVNNLLLHKTFLLVYMYR